MNIFKYMSLCSFCNTNYLDIDAHYNRGCEGDFWEKRKKKTPCEFLLKDSIIKTVIECAQNTGLSDLTIFTKVKFEERVNDVSERLFNCKTNNEVRKLFRTAAREDNEDDYFISAIVGMPFKCENPNDTKIVLNIVEKYSKMLGFKKYIYELD